MKRALGALLVVAACNPSVATEIVVTVDTTFGVPCTIDTLHIEIAGRGEPVVQEVAVTDDTLPGSITLVPGGDQGDVTVTVTGMRAGEPFAQARETTMFAGDTSLELRFLLDGSCVPGPCPAVGVGGYLGTPERQARRGCGAAGYHEGDSVFRMRDACAMRDVDMGSLLLDVDEQEAALPAVPFPFSFYGTPVNKIWVGSNGYVAFGDAAPHVLIADVGTTRSLGEPGFSSPGVLPFWDDLRTGPKGVCFATSGAAPDRILWITWEQACFAAGGTKCGDGTLGSLTFSVAIEETTDHVYLGYLEMQATGANAGRQQGSTATIGVTSGGDRGCAASTCSLDGTCESGLPCGYTEFSSHEAVTLPSVMEFTPL